MKIKLFDVMKNAICAILISIPFCLSAQNNGKFTLPQSIKCAYQDDVKQLAVELMLASQSADTNSISTIPTYENDIWKGLSTIINKGTASFVDTIFNKACIKKRELNNTILFIYNPDAEWIQEWKEDNEIVNNAEVVALLNNYPYRVSFYSNNNPFAALIFDEILNLKPLIEQLREVEDFENVRSGSFDGDGNNINIIQNDDILTFTFKLGWNVCPTGCLNNRFYEFVVDVNTCTLVNEIVYGTSNNIFNFYFMNCNIINLNEDPLNTLYKTMEFESTPISNFGKNANLNANGFEFKSDESSLPPLEPIHPKLTPGYSYFWNFGDGSYFITTKPSGFTDRIYNETGVYNVSVERTKIKSDPRFATEIERRTEAITVNSIATPPNAFFAKTVITNRKNVQLINVRDAVPGVPFTLVSSFKNGNLQMVDVSKATLTYNPNQLLHSNYDVYYCDELLNKEELDNGKKEIEIYNINPNEQRNFFSYFQINPKIELGEEIEVCLTYEAGDKIDEICELYIVGKSHDPSYKKFIEPNCFINDTLKFLIHLENDGNAPTMEVEVTDSLVPSLKIEDIVWDEKTDCHQTEGVDTLSESEEQVKFYFNPMILKGTNQPGYLKDFGYEEIKDEFTFKMKLENPLLSLSAKTYLCNEADIYFDDNPAYPISTCFVCFFNEMDSLPKKQYCEIVNVMPDVQQKMCPKLLYNNPVTVNKGDSIIIEADLSELPFAVNANFIWWPSQETAQTITVKPVEDTLFRLLAYWEENDTIFYVEDEVVVRVNFCAINENDFEVTVDSLTCYNDKDAAIEIKMNVDGDYSIFWDDVNDAIYGDQVFNRDMLSAGIYSYTIINNISCCKQKGSITIEEKTSLQVLIEKQKLEDDSYLLKAYYFGGQPPYNFNWSGNGQTFDNNVDEIGSVPNINYVFQITDAKNCEVLKTAKPFAGNFNCEEE